MVQEIFQTISTFTVTLILVQRLVAPVSLDIVRTINSFRKWYRKFLKPSIIEAGFKKFRNQ